MDSPFDPDTVDAPEDMKRVGNDHEALHNSKLDPKGYYTGFFHKDYQGNYAQHLAQKHHAKKHHAKKHHHHKRHENVMIGDHNNDTDDIVDDPTFLWINQRDHGNDTEDVPVGLEPIRVPRGLVQLSDHANDTADIPEGLDPIFL